MKDHDRLTNTEIYMDAIGQIRRQEAELLRLLCELGYDDASEEWRLTVEYFARLVSILPKKER